MKLRPSRIGGSLAAVLALSLPAAHADVVTDWNAIMQATVAPHNAFVQTRNAAITQLAVFEAVNAIVGDYEPYLGVISAPSGASPEAAAVAAAHRVLTTLYPDPATVATLDLHREASLLAIPDGPAEDQGIAVGLAAADAMLMLRASDGAGTVVPYTPGTNPGDWQPTPPSYAAAAAPGWGRVVTFGIEHGAQFRPKPPPALHTGLYARACNEVKTVGAVGSLERPASRTDVARTYAVLLVVNLYNPIARQLSAQQGKSLSENARIFALLGMASADALISSMEAKYHYQRWRPSTAIRFADTDGNPHTTPDSQWLPLITEPAFPSYPSNHACAGAAARAVLEYAYGKHGHQIEVASPAVPGLVLTYSSIGDIMRDIDDARIFGGIHFRFDQDAGTWQGRHVGQYIVRRELRPVGAAPRERDRRSNTRWAD